MLASIEENYPIFLESVQNDPRALILDMNGLLIHKVNLSKDMVFPTWNLQYDQILEKRPRRIYFLVRPDARQFLLWAATHFNVFIWSSTMEHNVVKHFCDCFPGLRGLVAGYIAQNSCDVLHNHKIKGKKTIFFKHLNDFWNRYNGQFGPHNTLLVDDSLYKCILNFFGNCCIVPPFGLPNNRTQRSFLTHKLAPWLYKYLKAGDRTQFVNKGGDVFGTWGSEVDLIVKDLIELHGHRSLECCYRVRWGKIEKKIFEEIQRKASDKVGDCPEQKEAYKVVWDTVFYKWPG
ncbi:hypothetical protein L7F22_015632 [Adiantum nelumboides]|nr:hypothetical protein [Adiantum nelumboides]